MEDSLPITSLCLVLLSIQLVAPIGSVQVSYSQADIISLMPKESREWLRHPVVSTVVGGLILTGIIATIKPLRGIAIEAAAWTWSALHHPIHAWIAVALAVVVVFLACVVWTRTQRMVELELEKLNAAPNRPVRPEPELVAVWDNEESRWGRGQRDGVARTYLIGSAHISMRNGITDYGLVQASVNGSAFSSIERIYVRRAQANLTDIFILVVPPIGNEGQPLEAIIIFMDNFGRRFALPPHTFRWTNHPTAG
jgi:hypothetical protein